jgi:hypothetical protein
MFTKLTDTNKAAIFSVLVLCMSLGAALLIRSLGLSPGPAMWTLWSITPTMATLIMLLVVTRDGYSKERWKSLGLHRLGLSVWWIAFGVTLLITVAASQRVRFSTGWSFLRSLASGWGTLQGKEGDVVLLLPALPDEGVELLQGKVPSDLTVLSNESTKS